MAATSSAAACNPNSGRKSTKGWLPCVGRGGGGSDPAGSGGRRAVGLPSRALPGREALRGRRRAEVMRGGEAGGGEAGRLGFAGICALMARSTFGRLGLGFRAGPFQNGLKL
jgi:hypothetical protein